MSNPVSYGLKENNGFIVVVDVDGTLTKVGDRVNCLNKNPPDWDEFYRRCGEDEPVHKIIDLVNLLETQYQIVFLTGRRESCRETTMEWLKNNGVKRCSTLLMRKNGDFRHDTIVKPELIKEMTRIEYIRFVLEDRTSMVKKWREMGVTCLQVADGDF